MKVHDCEYRYDYSIYNRFGKQAYPQFYYFGLSLLNQGVRNALWDRPQLSVQQSSLKHSDYDMEVILFMDFLGFYRPLSLKLRIQSSNGPCLPKLLK